MTTSAAGIQALFAPFAGAHLNLANRIVMAPMTRGFSPDGVPGPDVAAYYRRRAENGVGLIVTEGTVVNHPASAGGPSIPHFYGEEALRGWARVAAEVHAAGGCIVPQIWHVGMSRNPQDFPGGSVPSVGPSGLNGAGEQVTEPLGEAEIAAIVAAFGQAAADAQRLGFDGVEIHGAHGYLIDQFFWERTNRRTDRYGGGLLERTRFAVEVIAAVRRAVGPDFPVIFRFSQWKSADYTAKLAATPDELEQFLSRLADAGVDVFHCSTRRFWEPEFAGSDLNLAGWTKKLTGKPTITVGSVGLDNVFTSLFSEGKGAGVAPLEELTERLQRGEFDLVAVGRSLLGDPAWAAKLRDGRMDELVPFAPEAVRKLY